MSNPIRLQIIWRDSSRTIFAIILLLLLHPIGNVQGAQSDVATKALHALFAAEWDYEMEQYPVWASTLGDRRWNDRWEDLSLDAIQKRYDHHRQVLIKLGKIDRGSLSPTD